MRIDPKTVAFNEELLRTDAGGLTTTPMDQLIKRVPGFRTPPIPELAGLAGREIQTREGPLPLLIYRPPSVRGVLLYLHGGGWCLGDHVGGVVEDLVSLADSLEIGIVTVGYRLAPEHPFPAGVDDCVSAARWLENDCLKEFGTDSLLIGGDSSGAHLAAATMIRRREESGACRYRGIVLEDGWYDLRMSPSVRLWGKAGRHLIVTYEMLSKFVEWFAPGHDTSDPALSPIFADLTGLAPALFLVGTEDPLVDDTVFMEARWRLAGNGTELLMCPGGSHWFRASPTPDGILARARRASFLSRVLR